MTEAEMVEVVGILFGSYLLGWCVGALILYFKQFVEKI